MMINDRTEALRTALKENNNKVSDAALPKDLKYQKKVTTEFFKEVDEVSQCLTQIESNVEEVKKKLDATLSSPENDQKMKVEIEHMTYEIKRLGMKVRTKLKRLEEGCETEKKENGTSAQYRLRITQHSILTKRLMDTMQEFNQIQTAHRSRYKDRIKRELEIVGNIKTDDEIEEILEKGDPSVFTQNLLKESLEAKQALAHIEDRFADILQIEKSIRELHELFVDINFIVETQGEFIDHIERNVHDAVDFVDKGRNQVRKAKKHRKKVRRRKICLIIVGTIILVILLGVVIGILA